LNNKTISCKKDQHTRCISKILTVETYLLVQLWTLNSWYLELCYSLWDHLLLLITNCTKITSGG
jgi:hypothetical protein